MGKGDPMNQEGFNSLQTGKWRQREADRQREKREKVSIPFKRESGDKGKL